MAASIRTRSWRRGHSATPRSRLVHRVHQQVAQRANERRAACGPSGSIGGLDAAHLHRKDATGNALERYAQLQADNFSMAQEQALVVRLLPQDPTNKELRCAELLRRAVCMVCARERLQRPASNRGEGAARVSQPKHSAKGTMGEGI